jgi:hypothetical protein
MFAGMTSLVELRLPDSFTISLSSTAFDMFKGIKTSCVLYALDSRTRSLWPGVLGN